MQPVAQLRLSGLVLFCTHSEASDYQGMHAISGPSLRDELMHFNDTVMLYTCLRYSDSVLYNLAFDEWNAMPL